MEKKLFQESIEVPEIVQKKAEEAFSQIREGSAAEKSSGNMGRKRRSAVLAACMAVMLVFAAGSILFSGKDTGNTFVLTAQAAELQTGQPYVLQQGGSSLGINEGLPDESGSRQEKRHYGYYTVNVQLHCQGENIEQISYDVNRGAFQLMQKEGHEIAAEGTEIELLNCGSVGGKGMTERYYKHFTVDHENQGEAGKVWINLADDKVELPEGVGGEGTDWNKYIMDAISDTKLTCTIRYKDGRTEQAVLRFQAEENAEGFLQISLERMK